MKVAIEELQETIRQEALTGGFDVVGFAALTAQEAWREGIARWAQEGFAGGMTYLSEIHRRAEKFKRRHPGLKTAIVLGANYFSNLRGANPQQVPSSRVLGRVARYAWGRDYHRVLTEKMSALIGTLKVLAPEADFVTCVDTRPFSERSLAAEAGLGGIGRQGQLLSPDFGPWLFLAEIFTTLELVSPVEVEESEREAAFRSLPENDVCGSCTLCVDLCPTDAIRENRTIDARRCISYLTIEHKGDIPQEFRAGIKDRVFGCDECLEVCPHTRAQRETQWGVFKPQSGGGPHLDLEAVLAIRTNRDYERAFGDSAISRAGRKQLARNAAVVLGNLKDEASISSLAAVLAQDPAALVRRHAAWALGRIGTFAARAALEAHENREHDPSVLEALRAALSLGAA